jgi:hypothetical protein
LAALLLALGYAALQSYLAYRKAKRATDQASFEAALRSDQLEILGTYLRDRLGALSLDAYTDRKEVRERTRLYLLRLKDFLNQPQPVEPAAPEDESLIDNEPAEVTPDARQDHVIEVARQMILDGQYWSAFALLRRTIEETLEPQTSGKGRPIPLPQEIQPKYLQGVYGIFMRIANRAIHGDELTASEANRGWAAAKFLLDRAGKIRVGSDPFGLHK